MRAFLYPVLAASLLMAASLAAASPISTGFASGHSASRVARSAVLQAYETMPLRFEANHGQFTSSVLFAARGMRSSVFLTSRGMTAETVGTAGRTSLIRMTLAGANPRPTVRGQETLGGTVNYLKGRAATWRTRVPTFGHVVYKRVYPGIDLVFHGRGNALEYDFHIAPHARTGAIRLQWPDAQRVSVDRTGQLMVQSAKQMLRQPAPQAYQDGPTGRRPVTARYTLGRHNMVHLALGRYDHSRALVIDPTVYYSTYLGGSADDSAVGVAVDASGNAYVAGTTTSTNFPVTDGSTCHLSSGSCLDDIFVTELAYNATSHVLSPVYSTYVGGRSRDDASGIAVNGSGNAYVTGYSWSSGSWPYVHALRSSMTKADGVVFELNTTGTGFVYSTAVGGSDYDQPIGITVDGSNAAYVTGFTQSSDFPTCPGSNAACLSSTGSPYQTVLRGTQDTFVSKLTYDAVAQKLGLSYSTYLGGTSNDKGYGIAVDSAGRAFVAGGTCSVDFPTKYPLQASLANPVNVCDATLTKFSADGTSLIYSTYLGGKSYDFALGLAIDGSGNAFVTGYTESSNFPVKGALQSTFGGKDDAFVSKVAFNATTHVMSLVYSTYLGSTSWDDAYGIAVDSSGNAYVTGVTLSSKFPTKNPVQASLGGGKDAFVTILAPAGSSLVFSTFYGGLLDDSPAAIALDSSNNFYVAGQTASTNFKTVNPYQASNHGGATDAFVLKGHT